MTNKKINKTLAFIITTFAFFAFNINTKAESVTAHVGDIIDAPSWMEESTFVTSSASYVTSDGKIECKSAGEGTYIGKGGETNKIIIEPRNTVPQENGSNGYYVGNNNNSNNNNTSNDYSGYLKMSEERRKEVLRKSKAIDTLSSNAGSTIDGARQNAQNMNYSANSVSNGTTKLDGGVCNSYTICYYKNESKQHSKDEPGMSVRKTTKADGTVKETLIGPYLANQANIMYKAQTGFQARNGDGSTPEAACDYSAGNLTAFCLEAQFYGPADDGGCLNYKATPIRTDSKYEVALYKLYQMSGGGDLLGNPEEYFKFEAAARILAYYDDLNYQPRDATGISNIAAHAIPYKTAAETGNASSISTYPGFAQSALALAQEAAAYARSASEDLLNGAYGIRASQVTSFVAGNNGYEATFAVTVQNVNSADEVSFGDIEFTFGGAQLQKTYLSENYDAANKTKTFTIIVSGMSGEAGSCSNSTMKVSLTKAGTSDIRKAFMLDAVGRTGKNSRQRFAVFAPGAPSTVSYEIVMSNCVPEPPAESCQQDAVLKCDESDVNGIQVLNEGAQGGGDTDWEGCIIHKTDSQGNSYDVVDNSDYEQTNDDRGLDSEYIEGFLSSGEIITDMSYCTISCKEKYQFLLPGYKEQVYRGQYFSFHTNGVRDQHAVVGINAERKCVSTDIKNEQYERRVLDLRAQQVDYLNAYLYYYQLWKAMTSKEVIKAYNSKIRYAEVTPSIKPENINCDGANCGCQSDIEITNRSCANLANEEMKAACQKLGGRHRYIEGYEFTTGDNVDWDTGAAETVEEKIKIDMIYFTLDDNNIRELNNQSGDLLVGHSQSTELTLSYDEFVNKYLNGQYEITKISGATKEFYKRFYKSEDEDNNYYVFEDSVASIPEYSKTRLTIGESPAISYNYESGGHWERGDERRDPDTGVGLGIYDPFCAGSHPIPQTRGIKYFYIEENSNISSSAWDPEFTDYDNDTNLQLAKYIETVRKVHKSYEQAKKKYEALIMQISDQSSMMQECTNYLKNMESNVRSYEFDPIITFSYQEKEYMQDLAPNILERMDSTAPEVSYETYLCKSNVDANAVFGCNDGAEQYKFKYLYEVQLTESNEQYESPGRVHQELEGLEEHQNRDNAGLAIVEFYDVARTGSKAVYGRHVQNGEETIDGTTYRKYDMQETTQSVDGGFEFYQSATQFFTTSPNGIVTTNRNAQNANIIDTDGRVYPVAINTPENVYGFSVKFSNIGQFNETGTLGRIMGGGDGKPGTMVGEYGDTQVCWYNVLRNPPNEGDIYCTATNEWINCEDKEDPNQCLYDGRCNACPDGSHREEMSSCLFLEEKSQTECENRYCVVPDDNEDECPKEMQTDDYLKCRNQDGKSYDQCKQYCKNPTSTCDNIIEKYCNNGNVSTIEFSSKDSFRICLEKLIQDPSGCCEEAEALMDKRQADDYIKVDGGYIVPASVDEEFKTKCPPTDKYCEYFKIISESETYKTDIEKVNNDGSLQFNARTVSNNNLFPNGNTSVNWNKPEALNLITHIEDEGDGIFNQEPDYHVSLNGECTRKIKEYNQRQQDNDWGYLDYTNDIVTTVEGQSVNDLTNKTYGSEVKMSEEFYNILKDYCGFSGEFSNGEYPQHINDGSRVLS